jgi:hypothetical protein
MFKFLLFFFLAVQCWGQKLHHQVIATQGINTKISNGIIISQSVGQVNAAVGNFKNPKLIVGKDIFKVLALPRKLRLAKK